MHEVDGGLDRWHLDIDSTSLSIYVSECFVDRAAAQKAIYGYTVWFLIPSRLKLAILWGILSYIRL